MEAASSENMFMPLIAAVLTKAPSTTKWRDCGNLAVR
jgi:hypothetical protein